jgi:hypothetical protein
VGAFRLLSKILSGNLPTTLTKLFMAPFAFRDEALPKNVFPHLSLLFSEN